MVYLILAIASSLGIGVVFKMASIRAVDRLQLIAVNYLVAAVFGAGLIVGTGVGTGGADAPFLIFSIAVGAVLAVGFFLISLSTHRAGISLTLAVMRTGVTIPFLVSWLVWAEVPSTLQWGGFALVLLSLVFLTRSPDEEASASGAKGAALLLLAVFLSGGIGDLAFKSFDVWYAETIDGHVFLALAFAMAFVVSSIGIMRRPTGDRTPRRDALLWGLLLGVLNYGSILFVLGAVARIPAIVVFPTVAASLVTGGTVLGVLIWNERVTRVNLLGVVLAAAGVILLNI